MPDEEVHPGSEKHALRQPKSMRSEAAGWLLVLATIVAAENPTLAKPFNAHSSTALSEAASKSGQCKTVSAMSVHAWSDGESLGKDGEEQQRFAVEISLSAPSSGTYVIVRFAAPVIIDQATGAELVGGLHKGAVTSVELQLGRATKETLAIELLGRRAEPLHLSEDPAKPCKVRVSCQSVQERVAQLEGERQHAAIVLARMEANAAAHRQPVSASNGTAASNNSSVNGSGTQASAQVAAATAAASASISEPSTPSRRSEVLSDYARVEAMRAVNPDALVVSSRYDAIPNDEDPSYEEPSSIDSYADSADFLGFPSSPSWRATAHQPHPILDASGAPRDPLSKATKALNSNLTKHPRWLEASHSWSFQ